MSSIGSNINRTSEVKNPNVHETTEEFYKIFRRMSSSNNIDENSLIELLNIDYQIDENFKFSCYLIMTNHQKISEFLLVNNVFRNSLDRFLHNENFSNLHEAEFLKNLFNKENSKLINTGNLKTISNNINSFENQHILTDNIVSYDNEYVIKSSNLKEKNYGFDNAEYSNIDINYENSNLSKREYFRTENTILNELNKNNKLNETIEDNNRYPISLNQEKATSYEISLNEKINQQNRITSSEEKMNSQNNQQKRNQYSSNLIMIDEKHNKIPLSISISISKSKNEFENKSLNQNILNSQILKNNSRILNNSFNQNHSIKNISLNLSYVNPDINTISSSRRQFYSFFSVDPKSKTEREKYIKFSTVKEYFQDISKRDIKSKINNVYQKLKEKENYTIMDEELRLLYLNFFALNYHFFSNNQIIDLETNFLTPYILNNQKLGKISKNSQEIYKKIFFWSNKNPKVQNQQDISQNIVLQYLEKKDNLNSRDINEVFKSLKKIKSFISLFTIIVFDNFLDYLRADAKYKIKFFLYILIQDFGNISENRALLDNLYLFKMFFNDHENFNNCKNNESLNRSVHSLIEKEEIKFNKTPFEEINHNIANLFRKRFCKKGNSLIFNYINLDENYINPKINDFFDEDEINLFESVINKIRHFYSINPSKKGTRLSFITSENIDFVLTIFELVYFKRNQMIQYKKIYINLEADIKDIYKNQMTGKIKNNESKNLEDSYFTVELMYPNQTEAYYKVYKIVKDFTECKNLTNFSQKSDANFEFKLLPFGSVTQFLGSSKTDLDLYLHIDVNNNDIREKVNYIYDLSEEIQKFLKKQKSHKFDYVFSRRLLTYTFDLELNNTSVKIDINFVSYFGILNSSLLRLYSQIDQRFEILSIFLKNKLSNLELNNNRNSKNKINNYSWTLILLTFLQDVIQPPVLPKILSDCKNSEKILKIKYKINLNKDKSVKKEKGKKPNFLNNKQKISLKPNEMKIFFENMDKEIFNEIPDFLDDEINHNILEEFRKKPQNDMCVSEIFVSFLEYIIFYFKFESNFVYTSALSKNNSEGFYGKSNLKKDDEFKDIEEEFINSYILIRDPIDRYYNPTKSVQKEQLKETKLKLKDYYNKLISYN